MTWRTEIKDTLDSHGIYNSPRLVQDLVDIVHNAALQAAREASREEAERTKKKRGNRYAGPT